MKQLFIICLLAAGMVAQAQHHYPPGGYLMHPKYSQMSGHQKDSLIRMMRTRIIDLMITDVQHDVEEQFLRKSIDSLRTELGKCLKFEPGRGNWWPIQLPGDIDPGICPRPRFWPDSGMMNITADTLYFSGDTLKSKFARTNDPISIFAGGANWIKPDTTWMTGEGMYLGSTYHADRYWHPAWCLIRDLRRPWWRLGLFGRRKRRCMMYRLDEHDNMQWHYWDGTPLPGYYELTQIKTR